MGPTRIEAGFLSGWMVWGRSMELPEIRDMLVPRKLPRKLPVLLSALLLVPLAGSAWEASPNWQNPHCVLELLFSANEEGDRIRVLELIADHGVSDSNVQLAVQVLSKNDPSPAVRNAARVAYSKLSKPTSMPSAQEKGAAGTLAKREDIDEVDDEPVDEPVIPTSGGSRIWVSGKSPAQPGEKGSLVGPPPSHVEPVNRVETRATIGQVSGVQAVGGGSIEQMEKVELVPLTVPDEESARGASPAVISEIKRKILPRAGEAPPAIATSPTATSKAATPVAEVPRLPVAGAPSIPGPSVEGKADVKAPPATVPVTLHASSSSSSTKTQERPATSPEVKTLPRPPSVLPPAFTSHSGEVKQPAPIQRVVPKPLIAMDNVPRDAETRKQMARELLTKGRKLIQENRLDEAETALFEARELAVEYRRLEYSPKSLARDIALAREIARRKAIAAGTPGTMVR